MLDFDILIIGCGMTGAVIARVVAEKGKRVLILERRDHIGGNMYDYKDEHGIIIQKYGPHIFHASKKFVIDFVQRFEDWHEFLFRSGAVINHKFTHTPFNFDTIDTFYPYDDAKVLKRKLNNAFVGRESVPVLEVLQNSDDDIKNYAQFLFENDYAPYTAKQWNLSPNEIDPSVLARVPLRFSYREGYFTDTFQAVPVHSFTDFFRNMLAHENIRVETGIDALEFLTIQDKNIIFRNEKLNIPVVYTGEIDELFHYSHGRLPYRSLRFELEYVKDECKYPYPVMVFPQEEGYTRITEYKSLLFQEIPGSLYSVEYPLNYRRGGGYNKS